MSRSKPGFHSMATAQPLERRVLFAAAFAPVTFASSVGFVAGTAPVAVSTADFNGDGDIDLAVADRATDKVNVFFGNAQGAFSAGPVLSLGAPPAAIISGDFNGDGKPDIAVATTPAIQQSSTAIDVFLNTGAGTFGLSQISSVETNATPGEPVDLTAGDFNGDGKLDLAVTEYTSQSIAILSGNQNGTFTAPIVYAANQYPTAIVSGDFNNDGYPDLAVASTSANVFSGLTNDGTASNQVSLALDDARGNFSAGPNISISTAGTPASLALASLTTAATPGLLVGNTDGTVTVLTNTGGAFATSAVATASGGVSAIASGDFNLDGNADFVTADGGGLNISNSATIIPGIGSGMLSASSTLATGADPVAVVVADFNNDGKPDIATANEGDGTVSIGLNDTPISPIATSLTVTSSSLSTPAGTAVVFTATVKGQSVSPLPGESVPTGTVNFFDGSTLLGSSTLTAGTNQAQFSTANLIVGSHKIAATYKADPAYAASTSARITQVISPTATQGPDLIGTLISSTLPATVAPGETGVIKIQITNQGNAPAVGSITNSVFLSLDSTIDNSDTSVPVRGALARTNLKLAALASITLTGTVTIPAGTPLSDYLLLAQLDASGSLAESVSSNDTVVSPTTYAVSNVFGDVDGRPGIVLHATDSNGTPAIFRLTGPGNGAANMTDNGLQIILDGTNAASTLTVTGAAGLVVTDLSTDSAIGAIRAPQLTVTGNLGLAGGANSLTLASAGTSSALGTFTLGAGPATAINIGSVPGLNLNAAGGIKSITVGNWAAGSISAGWIATLRSTQQFAASLTLNGAAAPAGIALNSAIVGSTAAAVWDVTGNIGRVSVGSTTPAISDTWSLIDSGLVKSLVIGDSLYGSVSAGAFGSVQIHGSLLGAVNAGGSLATLVIYGNLDSTTVTAATETTGTLGSIRITGDVTASRVSCGAGGIRSITVLGRVDPASAFVAKTFPRRAVVSGMAVMTEGDPLFQIGT